MNPFSEGQVSQILERLFAEGELADRYLLKDLTTGKRSMTDVVADIILAERTDPGFLYRAQVDNFLNVSHAFGRFLYMSARAAKATRIVEFGTSMGISTIHLAAAIRDNGGGRLIGTEIEPKKAERACRNLAEAGLADIVEIRVGDARETLCADVGPVDMVLLDGALTMYLDVLKVLEPHLQPGAVILAENAFAEADGYLAYVRNPANGYLSQRLSPDDGRGNEFTIFTPVGR